MSFSFDKRYLLTGVLVYILGTFTGLNLVMPILENMKVFKPYTWIFSLVLVILSGILFFVFRKNPRIRIKPVLVCITVLVFIFGFYRAVTVTDNFRQSKNLLLAEKCMSGRVASEPEISSTEKTVSFTADIYEVGETSSLLNKIEPVRIWLHVPSSTDVAYGDSFECGDLFEMSSRLAYEGGFNAQSRLFQYKMCMRAYAKTFEHTDKNFDISYIDRLSDLGFRLRNGIINICRQIIPDEDCRALLEGVLTGDRTEFSDELYAAYKNSGFVHVVAVSGMHVAYLFMFLCILFKPFLIPKKYMGFIAIPVLVLFASIALFTPSACRAVIMMSVVLMSYFFKRQNDGITALSLAALILIFENPYCLENCSFLLSFGATAGILIYSPMISKRWYGFIKLAPDKKLSLKAVAHKGITLVSDSVILSLCSAIGISFFTAYFFGKIQWGSIIGNIFIIPVIGFIFIFGYLLVLLSLVCLPAGQLLGLRILTPVLEYVNYIASLFSKEVFRINVSQPHPLFFVVYLVICVGLYFLIKKNELKKPNEDKN